MENTVTLLLDWYDNGKYYKLYSNRFIGHLLSFITDIEGVYSVFEYDCGTMDIYCTHKVPESIIKESIQNKYVLTCITSDIELEDAYVWSGDKKSLN